MSYLYRIGNGRNNIAYTTTANSSTKYLRRLGSGRTNITWTTIPQGSTYNILNRTGTGRNNIAWVNLKIGPDLSATGLQNNMHLTSRIFSITITSDFNNYDISLARKNSGSAKTVTLGYNNKQYLSNRIEYVDDTVILSLSGAFNSITNPNFSDIVNYASIFLFCSQQPPAEYLNAISSVEAYISSRKETYDIITTRYGHVHFNDYNAFDNVLIICLNTDNIMSNVTTEFAINFS